MVRFNRAFLRCSWAGVGTIDPYPPTTAEGAAT
jgi:hypothetical protein